MNESVDAVGPTPLLLFNPPEPGSWLSLPRQIRHWLLPILVSLEEGALDQLWRAGAFGVTTHGR